ncbi:MAG: hypothetical protein RJA99_3167 [Pseudomonadota bacterium]|jgi:hypothetical protein
MHIPSIRSSRSAAIDDLSAVTTADVERWQADAHARGDTYILVELDDSTLESGHGNPTATAWKDIELEGRIKASGEADLDGNEQKRARFTFGVDRDAAEVAEDLRWCARILEAYRSRPVHKKAEDRDIHKLIPPPVAVRDASFFVFWDFAAGDQEVLIGWGRTPHEALLYTRRCIDAMFGRDPHVQAEPLERLLTVKHGLEEIYRTTPERLRSEFFYGL